VALCAELAAEALDVYCVFNSFWEPLDFELPRSITWRRWIDTYLDSPEDIVPWSEAPNVREFSYRAGPRSVVVLWRRTR
jgi:glycogen operon protein